MSFDQYSETPATNYVTPYAFTGMAPSLVKVAVSNVMADLASRFAGMHTTGGTATAYTVTQTRQFAALINGLEIIVLPNATNTGAATFAPDGLTAKNIFANGVAAIAGMIQINVPAYLKYDGTQWNLINPQRSTGSATLTLATGWATTPTGTVNYSVLPDGRTAYAYFASALTATSNAGTFAVTGWPTILQPTTTKRVSVVLEDNSAVATVLSTVLINSGSGTINGGMSVSGTAGFTTANVKGFFAGTEFSFTLD